jgi:hypothetical protein
MLLINRKSLPKPLQKAKKRLPVSKPAKKASTREESLWRAHREYEDKIKDEVSTLLIKFFDIIRKKWLGLSGEFRKAEDPFRINGKIYINPKTGKPLSEKEWETVLQGIDRGFAYIFRGQEELLVKRAMFLGKILQGMDYESRTDTSLKDISWLKKKEEPKDEKWQNSWLFAKQHAGELITGLQANARKNISGRILDSIKNEHTPRQLERALFDEFASVNRDWRRIAETEINDNLTNGLLMSEMEDAEEDETIFMIGISAGNACKYCLDLINQKVVVLSPKPVSGGIITIKGVEYPAIWPGKSNVGRKASNYWETIPLHPHCKCSWTRYYPEMAKLIKKSERPKIFIPLRKGHDKYLPKTPII